MQTTAHGPEGHSEELSFILEQLAGRRAGKSKKILGCSEDSEVGLL